MLHRSPVLGDGMEASPAVKWASARLHHGISGRSSMISGGSMALFAPPPFGARIDHHTKCDHDSPAIGPSISSTCSARMSAKTVKSKGVIAAPVSRGRDGANGQSRREFRGQVQHSPISACLHYSTLAKQHFKTPFPVFCQRRHPLKITQRGRVFLAQSANKQCENAVNRPIGIAPFLDR